ncbi:hypothetical protein SLS62_010365 [Diatrype stigma]|uniref:Tyrosinase copper-binding domain-containing protein n=1 Tax=Diatrype stigma TaxID=117547 RepID=A0AAN9YIB4_9PEZI
MFFKYAIFIAIRLASIALAIPGPVYRVDGEAYNYTQNVEKLKVYAQSAYDQSRAELLNGTGIGGSGNCSLANIRVRKEWNSLIDEEKKAYIDAVKCLQSKPALTPASVAPGAKTRFDDFVATLINQTLTIHYTGNFLSWHRYFVWLYEQALREECGYQGTQPYWDWATTAEYGLANSSLFDGSDLSMSGDGAFIPNQGNITLLVTTSNSSSSSDPAPIYLPPGTGGGCVTSGPFANMSVNLGPAGLSVPGGGGATVANPAGAFAHNPRCLKRSLTDGANGGFANASSVLAVVAAPRDVYAFQMQMQGAPGSGDLGVHGGGHYALGGDPGRDAYVSPGDPAFYLHHAMIDRTWWMWQMGAAASSGEGGVGGEGGTTTVEARLRGPRALMGTNTFLDDPPSANTTYEDYVGYGWAAGPPRQIAELMSTVGGSPFCYVYL